MKKIILSCAAALAMYAMVSCSSGADKIKDIYKDGTEQLKKCDGDTEKRNEIIKDTQAKVADAMKDMGTSDAVEISKDEGVVGAIKEFNEAAGNDVMKSAEDAASEMQKKMQGM